MSDLREALEDIMSLCKSAREYTRRTQQIHEVAMRALGLTATQREYRHVEIFTRLGDIPAKRRFLERAAKREEKQRAQQGITQQGIEMGDQHTAGIWNALIEETATVRDSNNNQLAIATHIKTRTGGRMDSGEVAANTRLMAAAPELLSSCKELMEFAEREGWLHVYINNAKAAISKATGVPT